jgi:hypothetical protein
VIAVDMAHPNDDVVGEDVLPSCPSRDIGVRVRCLLYFAEEGGGEDAYTRIVTGEELA